MSAPDTLTIAFDRLDWHGADAARIEPGADLPTVEAASALLMRVVRSAAAHAAQGAEVTPVSVTLDVTGPFSGAATLAFSAAIDRCTRTIVFANGRAEQTGRTVLTATAVYRIDR